ncbi:hypothetical protein [Photobacterium phosphoreum]|uniref:hypothetical protein n=1 Tax=Photobacterium phosphoreum TaxID=659 RepID=UPI000D150EA7|nr:hypothetical protein [Photobacterium phosphoreum]PSU64589.1 hypothetical protein CTM80_03885 [Photobacterium phosphoreum]
MKKSLQALIVLCACNISFSAFANTTSAMESPLSIPFSQQLQSYQYSGVINNDATNDFSFYGHQGQKITTFVTSNSAKLWVTIKHPQMKQAVDISAISTNPNQRDTYTLPFTGQYHIAIGEYPAISQRNSTQNYNFSINIK